jgi:predicted MFS family arabinose efflux permease
VPTLVILLCRLSFRGWGYLLSSESSVKSDAPAGPDWRWGVFANLAFTVILIASSASNIGFAMFDTSMSWLMTNLNPDPMMVSAVQVATTLPMFLMTLPAGALTDIVDSRRLLIGAQLAVTAVSVVFAIIVTLHLATPTVLLATTFCLGATGALAAPAWLVITPMLVQKQDLDSAVAINNASYNVSRAVGPALGGLTIAALSIAIPFWCFCVGNVAVVAALLWWRAPRRSRETLPAERLTSAVLTGLRYVRNSRDIDSTLIRAIAFFPFASAYWALLPLVARMQMHNGPAVYGVLLGTIGAGSILGSFSLNGLKARLGPDRLAALGTVGTVLALALYGAAREPAIAFAASLIAGFSWIIVMTTLFVSAQVALPDWVRGRGLAIFLTAYFGAMTLGSAVWGKVASMEGLSTALYLAAAGAALGLIVTARVRLQTAAALDLTPSMHWRTPVFVHRVEDDEGPILLTIDYRIDPKDRTPFLALMHEIGLERKRDGAYAWGVFEDTQVGGRIVETFLIQSLLELKHLRTRVTVADRMIEDKARAFLKEQPKVAFLVAPKRNRHARRKRRTGLAPQQEAAAPAAVG